MPDAFLVLYWSCDSCTVLIEVTRPRYRHEMPTDPSDPLSQQNMKDRYYGTNDQTG